MIAIERKTYSGLEWLGDVGGLFDALVLIGRFLVGPITVFTVKVELLTQVFRSAPANTEMDEAKQKIS